MNKKREYYDLYSLKNENIREDFLIKLENKYNALVDEGEHENMSTESGKKFERLVKCSTKATRETLLRRRLKRSGNG